MLRRTIGALALCALVGCCKTEEIPTQTRRLYSRSAHDRNEAALALAKCGSPEVDRAVGRLSELLYDENVGVQSSAAYALRKIDSEHARRALERATKRR
ncbi:MAG: HEAT repeat domain-containing protein [Deltaproteobacteria bacterium]|nr:HEAT repeat domain-containing protein [Deltaproteobacteria bacterium]